MGEETETSLGITLGITSVVTLALGLLEAYTTKDLWILIPFFVLILIQWLYGIIYIVPLGNIAGLFMIPYVVIPLWQGWSNALGSSGAIITFVWFVTYGLGLIVYYIVLGCDNSW